jgi:hypothetical protein
MPSTNSIINTLQTDFPQFHFKTASEFWWSAATKTIYIDQDAEHNQVFALHELSHALLGHYGYKRDIELLKLERDAWDYAITTLAPRYGVTINEDTVQDNLDTYRHWLHARSTCPECEAIGLQTKEQSYSCIGCGHKWRVNEARLCALRRYSLQTK